MIYINVVLTDGTSVRRKGTREPGYVEVLLRPGEQPAALQEGWQDWRRSPTRADAAAVTWWAEKYTTEAAVRRRIKLARKPWLAYFPWRPDDLPDPKGSPAALAKLMADPEYGFEEVDECEAECADLL